MTRPTDIIPQLPLKRILKEEGAKRVSDDAAKLLSSIIERYGEQIAERSVRYAEHGKRRTVLETDISLALGDDTDE